MPHHSLAFLFFVFCQGAKAASGYQHCLATVGQTNPQLV